jgi:hypothetical protein
MFEFCERPEMPEWLRGDLFLVLSGIQNAFGLRRVLAQDLPLGPFKTKIIELGAGSGESLELLARALPNHVFLATDKFPSLAAWQRRFAGIPQIAYEPRSVGFEDFDQVLQASDLQGSTLLLVAAFHHMNEATAQSFLKRAHSAKSNVLIVEPLSRSLKGVLLGFGSGLVALTAPVFLCGISIPKRIRLTFMTWCFPLIPFFISHDGVVSALRQRTPDEIKEMVRELTYQMTVVSDLGLLKNYSAILLRLAK